jgi:hypothetical protein
MAYEMRAGQGSAFGNRDRKEDWHADFRGKVMLPDGKVHYLDVWVKKTKNGDDWVSVKVGNETVADQPKQDAHSQAKSNGYQPQSVSINDMESDVPF